MTDSFTQLKTMLNAANGAPDADKSPQQRLQEIDARTEALMALLTPKPGGQSQGQQIMERLDAISAALVMVMQEQAALRTMMESRLPSA